MPLVINALRGGHTDTHMHTHTHTHTHTQAHIPTCKQKRFQEMQPSRHDQVDAVFIMLFVASYVYNALKQIYIQFLLNCQ